MVKMQLQNRRFIYLAFYKPHPQPLSNVEKGARMEAEKSVFLLPSPSWRGVGGEVKMSKDKGVVFANNQCLIYHF